ncbi:hypothetical protein PIROE2DRAFT_13732 [Piromyces sp. E2]|nr:hypothetical protein PIROE2DRAFT_13732 [Piromyces sp. E2]|eukprot:OUM60493.1 hypothetical protein PIROE2DRAFT_13732 [Piromyces sp. E2]
MHYPQLIKKGIPTPLPTNKSNETEKNREINGIYQKKIIIKRHGSIFINDLIITIPP